MKGELCRLDKAITPPFAAAAPAPSSQVKSDRIEVEAVRPSQNAVVQEYTSKEGGITQRFYHLAAFRDHAAKVALALSAVRERKRESLTAARFDPHHVDEFEGLLRRIHSAVPEIIAHDAAFPSAMHRRHWLDG
jgi:hypothetical protein